MRTSRIILSPFIAVVLGFVTSFAVAWFTAQLHQRRPRPPRNTILVRISSTHQVWNIAQQDWPMRTVRDFNRIDLEAARALHPVKVTLAGDSTGGPGLESAALDTIDLLPRRTLTGTPLLRALGGDWGCEPPGDRVRQSPFPFRSVAVTCEAVGWPRRVLIFVDPRRRHIVPVTREDLPARIILSGLVLNTCLYMLPWWLLLIVPGSVTRWRRRRSNRCINCGYSLAGLAPPPGPAGPVCPECGA